MPSEFAAKNNAYMPDPHGTARGTPQSWLLISKYYSSCGHTCCGSVGLYQFWDSYISYTFYFSYIFPTFFLHFSYIFPTFFYISKFLTFFDRRMQSGDWRNFFLRFPPNFLQISYIISEFAVFLQISSIFPSKFYKFFLQNSSNFPTAERSHNPELQNPNKFFPFS